MARTTTPNDTPENEVLNFKQNEEENLKDAWYILDTIIGGNFLGNHTVDSYGAIMNLVYDTEDANQKEKFEADLKKEINKLQRYRDQIVKVIQNTRLRGGDDKKKIQGNFTCNLFISTQTQVRKAVNLAYSSAVRKRMSAVISSASEFVRPDDI
ncbi:Not1 N-terminal domain, CCR4-Not complex component family protein [Hordeum vulgare]|nr:Not1 N-terminal domain, CCR4-Not complex component family protein [Hordeum vulgare]